MPRILTMIVTVLALGVAAPSVAAAQAEPRDVRREVERVLTDTHQRDLPGLERRSGEPGDPALRGRELERLDRLRREGRVDRRTGRLRDPGDPESSSKGSRADGPLSGLATMLLWGLVIVIAVIVGFAVYQQLAGYNRDVEPEAPRDKATDLQLAAVIERPRDDADELAARGRIADAIHTLLLRTLHELASQNLVRVTPAMTSREILGRVSLLGDAREALSGLIVAVEQTWFGDDVPQLADYQRCREQFDRFAAAYRRGAGTRA